jgi:hypothetical protein
MEHHVSWSPGWRPVFLEHGFGHGLLLVTFVSNLTVQPSKLSRPFNIAILAVEFTSLNVGTLHPVC